MEASRVKSTGESSIIPVIEAAPTEPRRLQTMYLMIDIAAQELIRAITFS